jgi:hypothetical protein
VGGSTAGPADAPGVVINDRIALRRLLWTSGELGPAQAYIAGEIDVEGDLADGLRRAWMSWLIATLTVIWACVLSPLLMTYFPTRRTGKALLEKHLATSRPGYDSYVKRTSGFFPLPLGRA